MTKFRTRKPKALPLAKNIRLNFLLGCPENALGSFELARFAAVADARKQMHALLDQMIDETAQAMLAAWFRTISRDDLRRALENPDDVMVWAREQIRLQGRSDEDLLPLPALPRGAAHLAAALRYQERNLAEGKCAVCPEPLARNSVRYCEKHLTAARLRIKPKNAKGAEPGSIGWLHGEGFESQHGRQPGTLQSLALNREKKSRAILADMGLPLGSAATALQAAKGALLEHMPRSKQDALTVIELFDKAGLSGQLEGTAKKALRELVSAGLVQRIGNGVSGDPFLYFTTGGK